MHIQFCSIRHNPHPGQLYLGSPPLRKELKSIKLFTSEFTGHLMIVIFGVKRKTTTTLSISLGFDKVVFLAREQIGSNGRSH